MSPLIIQTILHNVKAYFWVQENAVQNIHIINSVLQQADTMTCIYQNVVIWLYETLLGYMHQKQHFLLVLVQFTLNQSVHSQGVHI